MKLSSYLKDGNVNQAYGILIETVADNRHALTSLSDYSMMLLEVENLKPIKQISMAHNKKINGIYIGDENCFSASNDGTVKVWDFKSKNPNVATYKCTCPLFYSNE